jgi:hypothetical protein
MGMTRCCTLYRCTESRAILQTFGGAARFAARQGALAESSQVRAHFAQLAEFLIELARAILRDGVDVEARGCAGPLIGGPPVQFRQRADIVERES